MVNKMNMMQSILRYQAYEHLKDATIQCLLYKTSKEAIGYLPPGLSSDNLRVQMIEDRDRAMESIGISVGLGLAILQSTQDTKGDCDTSIIQPLAHRISTIRTIARNLFDE